MQNCACGPEWVEEVWERQEQQTGTVVCMHVCTGVFFRGQGDKEGFWNNPGKDRDSDYNFF